MLPPRSKRTQLGNILAVLANLKPAGKPTSPTCLHQLAAMIRSKSLIMLFSDLLTDPEQCSKPAPPAAPRQRDHSVPHPRRGGGSNFPFEGLVEFVDVESDEELQLDAKGMREDYRRGRSTNSGSSIKKNAAKANIDYVPLHTGITFDKALIEYLINRQRRF